MFRITYKKANARIDSKQAYDRVIKRIDSRKKNVWKEFVAVAACALIAVTGICMNRTEKEAPVPQTLTGIMEGVVVDGGTR